MEDLEKKIFSILNENNELCKRGSILTGQNGDILKITGDYAHEDHPCSGFLDYRYDDADNSLEISCLQNNHDYNTGLKEYADDEARKKGLLTLFATYKCIAELTGVTKLLINTWILAAKPDLLTDKGSFFYKWKPTNEKDHKDAVKANKGRGRLRDQQFMGDLVVYYKRVRVKKNKKKFDLSQIK